MELTFENTLTFTDGNKTCHSHEPNNTFTEFYLGETRVGNKDADPVYGNFSALSFVGKPRRLTHQPVKNFGVKTFPHVGSYGFYTPIYSPTSFVVIPINRQQSTDAAPVVTLTDTGTDIHVEIEGNHTCYRIEVRLDYFATEFITYDTNFYFTPMYTGTCTITVTGFSNEISLMSAPFETEMVLTDRT